MIIKVVILTASKMRKVIDHIEFNGRCVTGINLETNKIVRFVRNKFGAPMEHPYYDDFQKLNLLEVSVKEACPLSCQTENMLVNYQYPDCYGKTDLSIRDLFKLYLRGCSFKEFFMDDNSYKLDDISIYDHSLEMILVTDLIIRGNKCSFNYLSRQYNNFSLTDTDFILKENQIKKIGNAYLAVSIPTSPWDDGCYYKFVAAIYPI